MLRLSPNLRISDANNVQCRSWTTLLRSGIGPEPKSTETKRNFRNSCFWTQIAVLSFPKQGVEAYWAGVKESYAFASTHPAGDPDFGFVCFVRRACVTTGQHVERPGHRPRSVGRRDSGRSGHPYEYSHGYYVENVHQRSGILPVSGRCAGRV